MPKLNTGGSGTLNIDFYREGMALNAVNVLSTGRSIICRSADHSGAGELCVETIFRLRADTTRGQATGAELNAVASAIEKLRQGLGHHLAQGSHSGGNTCAQVLAATTTP